MGSLRFGKKYKILELIWDIYVVSRIQLIIGCQPEKSALLRSGQSRLLSAEQGKGNKIESLAAHLTPIIA